MCYCTRCLRNDLIIKLKKIFVLLGGDLNDICNESIFEKYMDREVEKSPSPERKVNFFPKGKRKKMKG